MSPSHGNHILLSQTGISASGLYAETQTRCQKELLSSRLCNRIKDNSGLQSENSFYASVAWLDAQGSSCFISDLIFRPGSPCFSWSRVKICISLIKIIQMCLAELIFICFLFFLSYANRQFRIKSLENSGVDIIPTWKTGAAAPSSMVCFIIKRYYIIVVSIPDTLIVIPPTHTLSGKTRYHSRLYPTERSCTT